MTASADILDRIEQPYMAERWFSLLVAAVETDSRGRAGVAERIGYSRGAVSNTLKGNYGAGVDGVAQAVLDHYDNPDCPLMGGRAIARRICRRTSLIQEPIGGDARTRWLTCQNCANRPVK